MTIYTTTNHQSHNPTFELFNGEREPHSEIPDRVENIIASLRRSNHRLIPVPSVSNNDQLISVLEEIHDQTYINWLRQNHHGHPLYPSVFNTSDSPRLEAHESIQWGNFATDLFTPLLPNTWEAASTMAQATINGSQQVIEGRRVVVVVGRPPGHHASRSRVGGYCYLNNAAVGAQQLLSMGKVAILDVDYHHGNGTQDIFYDRDDVITCSIHAHPKRKFPYFAGFSDENGLGDGDGYNRNYPLEANITNQRYQPVLESAINWISNFTPQSLVISLGLDTHESDPIADFQLTTSYYQKMAQTINQLNLPTLIVLEGGYNTEVLGDNLISFLSGFESK